MTYDWQFVGRKRPLLWILQTTAFLKVFRCGPRRDVCRGLGRPALANLGRRKPRGAGWGLWGKHWTVVGQSVLWLVRQRQMEGRKVCDKAILGWHAGLVRACPSDFAVIKFAWPKRHRSLDATSVRASFEDCDGHFIMLPALSVVPEFVASGRGGRSR